MTLSHSAEIWHSFRITIWDDIRFVQGSVLFTLFTLEALENRAKVSHCWLATCGGIQINTVVFYVSRVNDPLKELEGSDGTDLLFWKAALSVPLSLFTEHQRSTCRALQRSGVKPYVLWYCTRQKTKIHLFEGGLVQYLYIVACAHAFACGWPKCIFVLNDLASVSCRDFKCTRQRWFVLVLSVLNSFSLEN